MHYYKRNIGDYAKKAGRLSMLQHGAYTLLIDACYDRERFPTLEEAIEWTWASTTEEIEAVTFVLRKFFYLVDGVYTQNRIQEEIDGYHSKAETNTRIAIEREAKRKEKRTNRVLGVNEPPPNHKPRTSNQEPTTTPRLVTEYGQKPENPAPLEIANPKITPHGAMAIELSKRGVAITSMNPDLLDWIEKGVTIPQACEAIALARQKKPEPERISAGYLNTIIHGEIINPKQKKPSGPAWWSSDSATNAKASELGLAANRGEEMSQFRDRIRKSLENKTRGVAA